MTTASTGIEPMDRAIQDYNAWIRPLADRLETSERALAHRALRATLHALRDRMGPDAAATLAAQLPLLVRGIFFEGFQPTGMPAREHSRAAFLEQVHAGGVQPLDVDQIERTVKAVLAEMNEHLDHAVIDQVAAQFPEEFSDFWPATPLEWDARDRKRHGPLRAGEGARPAAKVATGVEEVDAAIVTGTQWVDALVFRLNANARQTWAVLIATLQALREQLDPDATMRFAMSLPLPLRGAYFEGWKLSGATPVQTRSGFLQRLEFRDWNQEDITPERALKVAIEVISRKVPAAEMAAVAAALPQDLRGLWEDEPVPYENLDEARPPEPSVAPPAPPARGSQNLRRARNRAPTQTARSATASKKPVKRAR